MDSMDLQFKEELLNSPIEYTDIDLEVADKFDVDLDIATRFEPIDKPNMEDFNICLIVGASGSGKSTLLEEFGTVETIEWDNNKSIISHFDNSEIAIQNLMAVGLNSVPTWFKPYSILSTGEKFRADLSKRVKDNAVIDEFTSVIDRNVAKSVCVSLGRYIHKHNIKNVVIASCHKDIVEWLNPDYIIDTDTKKYYKRGCLRRPPIKIDLYRTHYSSWGIFRKHHYLNYDINKSSRCYIALWEGNIIGFTSVLRMPNPYIKNGWREHRTVILPDYQGLGIGVRLSDFVGDMILKDGGRYFSRTSHPRMGFYRELSPKWKPTSKNKKKRVDVKNNGVFNNHIVDTKRTCFSHEYIGVD